MSYKIRMRNSILLLSGLIVFFAFLPKVIANTPSSMTLDYDDNTDQLDVSITHVVSMDQNHYIQTVQIKIDSMLNQTHPYTSQVGDTFSYNYTIEAAPGSTIEVTAICSIAGQVIRSIVVPGGQNGTPGPQPTIPINICFVGLWFLSGIVFIAVIKKNKLNFKG